MYSKTSHQSKCTIIELNIFPNDKNNLILFIKLLTLKLEVTQSSSNNSNSDFICSI